MIGRRHASSHAGYVDGQVARPIDLRAPSASMQASVEAQSAPVEKFVNRDVPSAKAASIAYRWLMDLSPGSFRLP